LAFQAAICESLGLRNSMLLDERCFIVVEGDTEDAAVPLLFPIVVGKTLVAAGIHRLNTRGGGSMRAFVTALKTQLKRDVVLLADTEAASQEEEQRRSAWLGELGLSVGNGAYYVGGKEFEDAFSDEVWLRALTAEFPPVEGRPSWSLTDLESFRSESKFSDALHKEVCRRCKDSGIRKPDLGRALAGACCGPGDIPPVLQECFLFAHRLTGRA
jgi:hypothetical protein